MDSQKPSEKLYRAALAITTASITIASFVLSNDFGNVVGLLFSYGITIWILSALLVWFAVAWVARRMRFGNIKGLRMASPFVIGFGLLRVGLSFSCGILLVGWFTASVTGWSLATAFIRAAVLLMIINFIVGLAGGATINSVLAFRRARRDITH